MQVLKGKIPDLSVPAKMEESPVASSGSNGHVERAYWEIEAQVRVLKHEVEESVQGGLMTDGLFYLLQSEKLQDTTTV